MSDALGTRLEVTMPTTKTTKTKAPRSAGPGRTKRAARAKDGRRGGRYVAPAAAVLGAGALSAAGFFLREPLTDLVRVAVEGLTMTKHLAFAKLFTFAGVERKRSFLSVVMPGFGGFAVGVVSGAALALWLAPGVRRVEAATVFSRATNGTAGRAAETGSPPAVHIST
jgi:hypothetical protein